MMLASDLTFRSDPRRHLSRLTGSLAVLVAVMALAACNKEQTKTLSEDAVVVVGDHVITLPMLEEAYQRALPGMTPKEVLQQMIQRQSLVQSARDLGLEADPAVVQSYESLLIRRLRELQLEPKLKEIEVSDEMMAAIYEQKGALFARPERRRLAMMVMADEPANRVVLQEALEAAEDLPPERAFGQLAYEHSDLKRSRYRGGDCGWIEENNYPSHLPYPLIEAGFALSQRHPCSEIIVLDDSIGIVRLMDIEPAYQPVAEALKPQLRAMALKEKRLALLDAFNQQHIDAVDVVPLQMSLLETIDTPSRGVPPMPR